MTGTSVFSYPGGTAYADIDTDDVGGKKVQRVRQRGSSTSTCVAVAGSVTNVTLLAANPNRLGAAIYNNSVANMYVKLGANTAISWTVILVPNAYYEVPFGYTGIIDGSWASAGAGNAYVTEIA